MRLTEYEYGYRVRFDNSVTMQILVRDGFFQGLGTVSARRRKLRGDDWPIVPLIQTPDGWRVSRLKIRDVSVGDEDLRIEMIPYMASLGCTEWVGWDGEICWSAEAWGREPQRDRGGAVKLELTPVSRSIGGLEYVGFSYAYSYRSRKHGVYRLHDRSTWELGGSATGNSFWMTGPYNPPRKTVRNKKDSYTTAGWQESHGSRGPHQFLPFFSLLQGFTFQFDSRSLLVTTIERPSICRSLFQKTDGVNCLVHWHQLLTDLTNSANFPAHQVLWADAPDATEAERANQYCAVRSALQEAWEESGLARREEAVRAGLLAGDVGRAGLSRDINEIARTACERVYVPSLLHGLHVAPIASPQMARVVDKVADLIEHAHQRGVEVGTPLSSLLQVWHLRDAAGLMPGEGESVHAILNEVFSCEDTMQDFIAYAKEMAERLGIDVLLVDCLLDGAGCVERQAARPAGSAPTLQALSAEEGEVKLRWDEQAMLLDSLRDSGIDCIPGSAVTGAPLGYPSVGEGPVGCEFMLRDLVVVFPSKAIADGGMEPAEAYFRACAHRVGYLVHYDGDAPRGRRMPDWYAKDCTPINMACHAVREYMEECAILSDDRGVVWRGADSSVQVLWSYTDRGWEVGPDADVFDVMATQPTEIDEGRFQSGALRVYLVQNGADLVGGQ